MSHAGRADPYSARQERTIISLLARRRFRHRCRAAVGVAVLVAITTWIAMFAVAGARRTQSAYPRLLGSVDASTLSITTFGNFDAATDARIASFPEVAQSRTYVGFNVLALDGTEEPDPSLAWESIGTFDGRYFDQDRFTATSGRASNPNAVNEVVLNEFGARQLGLSVDEQLELATYSNEQVLDPSFTMAPTPPQDVMTATIVGIGLFPDEVLQDDADRAVRLLLTPAYSEQLREFASYGLQGLILHHGDADIAAVKRRMAEIVPPGTVKFRVTSVDTFHAEQAIRPLAIALAVFGAVIGMAGLLMATQACNRLVRLERADHDALGSFGIARRTLAIADALLPLAAVVAGTVMGIVLAIAASPLAPIGPVRRIEVSPGIDIDLQVLGSVAVVVLVVLIASIAIASWRGARTSSRGRRSTARVPRWQTASATVLPATGAAGLHLTCGSDQRTGVSARSVVVAATTGVAALVVALTFSASLERLVNQPDLYGWNWDAAVVAANGYGNLDDQIARAALTTDAGVAAWSGAYFGTDVIDGQEVPLLGVEVDSAVLPPIVTGRTIHRDGEVVLGSATARELGVDIGDEVVIGDADRARSLEVVGLATFPAIGPVHVARTSLGVGAMVLSDLVPGSDLDITASERGDFGPNVIFVRFVERADREAALGRLRQATEPLRGFTGLDVLDVQRPAEIVNSSALGRTPLALAGALLLGALASLALSIGSFVRRRRHDLAVLRTLGFTARQMTATVSWQAALLVTPGVLAGVPLGVLVGRLLWGDFAERMDAIANTSIPVLSIVGIAMTAYVVALVAAGLHARTAARLRPAELLRTE